MNDKTSRFLSKILLTLEKYSPEIMLGLGIAGGVATVVTACKATVDIQPCYEEHKDAIDDLKTELEDEHIDEKEYKKEAGILHKNFIKEATKTYILPIGLGLASGGFIVGSHCILKNRNAAITSALATVTAGFAGYRNRVKEKYGEEEEKKLRFGVKEEVVEEKTVDAKGKEKVKKNKVTTYNFDASNEYSRFFDEFCIGWQRDAEYNLKYLTMTQDMFNDQLRKKGYVFLNDVYKYFGLRCTKAGQVVGWIFNKNGEGEGDNYIDFGIFDKDGNPRCMDFVNGREQSVLMTFNVDGVILDKLKNL